MANENTLTLIIKNQNAVAQNYCFSTKNRYLCMIINIDKNGRNSFK